MASQMLPAGSNQWITVSYWCPRQTDPVTAPTARDLRDEAIRLLPPIPLATTAPNTLVNIQTLFWAVTDTHRDLGRVRVLGRPVWLALDFDHADWDFGDGHTDTTHDPGKAYDAAHDGCDTVLCPHYYGHIYRSTGQMRVTVRVTWQASYSLDGVHYHPVGAAPITGPPGAATVRVREARTQLVSD